MNFNRIISFSLRIINRSRLYSAINLLGLALGLTVFMLIALFVRYEFGYDRHNENYDRIYRIVRQGDGEYMGTNKYVVCPAPMAAGLKESVKEADHVTRISRRGDMLVKTEATTFFEQQYFAVDPDFFKIFTLEVIAGAAEGLLTNPTDVVLSESIAIKYFGSVTDAVGKTISAEQRREFRAYTVQAVFRDMPFQSHFRPMIMFQFENLLKIMQPSDLESWNNNNNFIYFTLQPGTDIPAAAKALNAFVQPKLKQEKPPVCIIQPLSDVYLGERMNFDVTTGSDPNRLYIFLCVGILVLVIACINYINMATARSTNRAREIGVRKVNGALRIDLISQFLVEAVLTTMLSAIAAICAVTLLLPFYNAFLEKQMNLNVLLEPMLLAAMIGLVAFVAIAAGAYPAFLFSSFKPIQTLKGNVRGAQASVLRHVLVVFQFVISGTLVFGTLIVWKQMDFVKSKDLGFDREHVVIVTLRDRALREKHAEIGDMLMKHPGIHKVSASISPPTGITAQMGRKVQSKSGEIRIGVYHNQVDTNFLDLYDIKLLAGSNLTSRSGKYDAVVNETFVRELGYENDEVIGRLFIHHDSTVVVGVVSDFHFSDFKLKIEPAEFRRFNWGPPSTISVKIDEASMRSAIDHIKTTLAGISEKYPFEYTFYDDHYGKTFITEEKTSKLMTVFSAVAIIVAALGLYGLILHMVNQRMKEIGIRKVLGAGAASIVRLLSGKFGVLILVGYTASCIVGYYGMQKWLEGFAYRVSPGVIDFVITLVTIVIVTGLAVSSRMITALRINPAAVLKQEG